MPIQMILDGQSVHSPNPATGKVTLSLVVQHGTFDKPDEEYLAVEVICSEERRGPKANGVFIALRDLDDNLIAKLELSIEGPNLVFSQQKPGSIYKVAGLYPIPRSYDKESK